VPLLEAENLTPAADDFPIGSFFPFEQFTGDTDGDATELLLELRTEKNLQATT
jgi:hypothetical protein